jgi:hypothetical protein
LANVATRSSPTREEAAVTAESEDFVAVDYENVPPRISRYRADGCEVACWRVRSRPRHRIPDFGARERRRTCREAQGNEPHG